MKLAQTIENSPYLAEKGNGRIFVKEEAHVTEVLAILRTMDRYEYDYYKPDGIVAVLNPTGPNELIYTANFQINVKRFVQLCSVKKIPVFVFACNPYQYEEGLTLEKYLQLDRSAKVVPFRFILD